MSSRRDRRCGRSWSWPRQARVAAVVFASGLLATACSASSSSSTGAAGTTGANGSTAAKAVAYAQCMRTHGVQNYPGPSSDGQLPKVASGSQVGVSDTTLHSAAAACASLWPNQAPAQSQQQSELTYALKFAQCMRSHGVPTWPDPITNANSGRVEFVLSTSKDGFDPNSSAINAKVNSCEHGIPASMLPGSKNGVQVSETS